MSDPNLSSFVGTVADPLRGDYKQSEYRKVILPLTAIASLALPRTRVILVLSALLGLIATPVSRAADTSPKVGDRIDAVDYNGNWVTATVLKIEGNKRFVQYEGKSDYWNAWVEPDKYRIPGNTAAAPRQPAGERVEALDFNTTWKPATVLKTDGERRFVHFDGKSDYWDQWETPDRVRPFGAGNALALAHLAPEQAGDKGLNKWIIGTQASAQGQYDCTFYWFRPDGHVFVGDMLPKHWSEFSFADLQKADAVHCGTYGLEGAKMRIQLNNAASQAIAFGNQVIGSKIAQTAWTFEPGQRLEGGFGFGVVSNFGGVSAVASDSWYFHADGTFKRVKVAGVDTNDSKAAKDPHPAKATANESQLTEGRYDFAKGNLQLTDATGSVGSLACMATGKRNDPILLVIGDVAYKANSGNKPWK